MLRFDIISAVPGILQGALSESIIKRGIEKKLVEIKIHNLRDYASDKYKHVDDKPFGGGAGMVLMAEPMFKCIEKLTAERKYDEIIFLSPQGTKFNQRQANKLSLKKNLMFICGHYKGVDQRVIDKFVTKEISIGDYVLTGGELAAAVIIDAVVRLVPGVLGNGESALTDSFQIEAGFDAPQYTRPAEFKGMKAPDILLSGDHKKISEWRKDIGKKKFNKVKRIKKK